MQLTVRVHPGATRNEIRCNQDGSLEVWLRARAVEGQANEGLMDVLSGALGLRKREVRLVGGLHARIKRVEVPLQSATEVAARLQESEGCSDAVPRALESATEVAARLQGIQRDA